MTLRSAPFFRSPLSRQGVALALLLAAGVGLSRAQEARPVVTRVIAPAIAGLDYIDGHSFENASPVWYEQAPDGAIHIHLLYDHARASPNRAAGHMHLLLDGKPGAKLTLEFKNLDNVYNGVLGPLGGRIRTAMISENGRDWTSVPMENLPGDRLRVTLTMPGTRLYLARIEPYRLSDLEKLLASIRENPLVEIAPIGKTVQGRELEIVRVGRADAPYRVFLRARAHPWETAGSWVVQGLIRRLLRDDPEARKYLARYCVHIMPMANKDGVAHGRTRFNFQGKDLNREWGAPADPLLAPENAALETWLETMIAAGRKPDLALELHNDENGGRLHLARPLVPELPRYLDRMAALETLLRRHTWFTEGSTGKNFRNPGALGDGWLERHQIHGVTHEFHSNWIAGLKDYPCGRHWETYGNDLATVLYEYFGAN